MNELVVNENVIEWLKGSNIATVTLCNNRYASRVKKLAKKYPEVVQIVAENKDGSIMAHIPLKAVKINIIQKKKDNFVDITEEVEDDLPFYDESILEEDD